MAVTVNVDGVDYELDAEPVRTSLSDNASMLWGFPVNILRDGERVSRKTCFVGRISVMSKDPDAPDAPFDVLEPILHELAFARVIARIEQQEFEDEIVFA